MTHHAQEENEELLGSKQDNKEKKEDAARREGTTPMEPWEHASMNQGMKSRESKEKDEAAEFVKPPVKAPAKADVAPAVKPEVKGAKTPEVKPTRNSLAFDEMNTLHDRFTKLVEGIGRKQKDNPLLGRYLKEMQVTLKTLKEDIIRFQRGS